VTVKEVAIVRAVTWLVAGVFGVLWWGAALRLAIRPGEAGPVAAAVVTGWTLSILPVHCLPIPDARRRRRRWWTSGKRVDEQSDSLQDTAFQ
jgi:hypothetical protein